MPEAVEAFLTYSVNGRWGRAVELLGRHPEISGYDIRTAVALGDASRVGAELERDRTLIARRDPRTGWSALHLACASRWHMEPVRADGLCSIVRMLLDAGADFELTPTAASQWSPLRCTVASAGSGRGNEPILRLLLERGAAVADQDLYLAGFATGGEQWCLRLLVQYAPDVRAIAEQALAAPISLGDTESVRVLLDAGADPARYRDDDGEPTGIVRAAIAAGCGPELIELLLAHGADPNERGEDGRSAYAVAMASGRSDPQHHELREELADADASALVAAAESGNAPALALLLEVGFSAVCGGRFDPAGVDGVNALHAAAWAGNPEAVRQLLAAGVPVDTKDGQWGSPPLEWALIGSSERRTTNPNPDWLQTVRILLDAGAAQVNLDAVEPHSPSPEVLELLRARGLLLPGSTRG